MSQRRKIGLAVLVVVLILIAGGVAYAVTFGADLRLTIAGRPVGFAVTGLRARAAIAATVNGEPIYWSEVDAEVARAATQFGVNLTGPNAEKQRAELTTATLDQLIDQRLILQAARKRAIDASDSQISAEIDRIRGELGGEPALQAAMERQKLTMADVRRLLRLSLTVRALIPQVAPVQISDEELRKAYDERKKQFDQPEQIRVSHILIRAAGPQQEDRAKQTILLIQGRLARGEKFADLAKQYSEDPGSKDRGGDLGFVNKGTLDPAFEQAAFALKAGEVSGPVKSQFGYHLILFHERKPAHQATFAEVQKPLRDQLVRERQEGLFQKWLQDERKKAKITRQPRPAS